MEPCGRVHYMDTPIRWPVGDAMRTASQPARSSGGFPFPRVSAPRPRSFCKVFILSESEGKSLLDSCSCTGGVVWLGWAAGVAR